MLCVPAGTLPLMTPVVALMERPVGSPVAEYVNASKSASDAEIARTNEPGAWLKFPGFSTEGATFVEMPFTSFEAPLNIPVAV